MINDDGGLVETLEEGLAEYLHPDHADRAGAEQLTFQARAMGGIVSNVAARVADGLHRIERRRTAGGAAASAERPERPVDHAEIQVREAPSAASSAASGSAAPAAGTVTLERIAAGAPAPGPAPAGRRWWFW